MALKVKVRNEKEGHCASVVRRSFFSGSVYETLSFAIHASTHTHTHDYTLGITGGEEGEGWGPLRVPRLCDSLFVRILILVYHPGAFFFFVRATAVSKEPIHLEYPDCILASLDSPFRGV